MKSAEKRLMELGWYNRYDRKMEKHIKTISRKEALTILEEAKEGMVKKTPDDYYIELYDKHLGKFPEKEKDRK